MHYSSNGCLVMEFGYSCDYFLLNLISMETIQLPSVDFDYLNCILWRSPSDFNCRTWFINDNFLMSCQSGDNEYFKKQIQFDDEEEFQFEDKENYMKVDNGNEEFDINNEEFQHDNDKSEDCACRGE